MDSDVAAVPRKGVRGMVVAQAIASLLALPAPALLVVLVAGSMPGALMPFADGVEYAWITPSIFLVTALVLGVLGSFFLAGKKVPGSLLYATAVAPFIAGVTVAALQHKALVAQLASSSAQIHERPQVLAAGSATAETTVALGAATSAIAMLLVALASVSRVLTLDASAIDPSRARRAVVPMAITAGAMVVAIAIASAARVHLHSEGAPLSRLVLMSSLGIGVLAAWRAPLAAIVDREDADTFRTLVLLAIASASSVLFGGVAAYAIARSEALDVIGGFGVLSDHSIYFDGPTPEELQMLAKAPAKARLLTEALLKMHAARLLGWIDAVVLLLGLGVPAMASGVWRTGLRPRASLVAWGATILLVASAGVAQTRLLKKASAPFHQRDPAAAVAGLVVPTARASWAPAEDVPSPREHGHVPLLYVTRDGKLLLDLELSGTSAPTPATETALALFLDAAKRRTRAFNEGPGDHDNYLPRWEVGLVADRDVTYGTLRAALAQVLTRIDRFSLAIAPAPEKLVDRSALGDLASFVAHDGMEAPLSFYDTTDPWIEPSFTIVVEGASAKVVAGSRDDAEGALLVPSIVVPMGEDREGARHKIFEALSHYSVGIAPRDDDTLAAIFELADEMRSFRATDPTIVLSSDRRALLERAAEPREPTTGTKVRMRSVSVKGRLQPEAITRIVRQNFGKLQLCYEDALRAHPTTSPTNLDVRIEFVIDGAGAATAAALRTEDVGTTRFEWDVAMRHNMAPCIVRTFAKLTFPRPEEGIVPIVFDLAFSGTLP